MSENKTETPRVDNQAINRTEGCGKAVEYVPASFARELERENAELRKEVRRLQDKYESTPLSPLLDGAAMKGES